MSTRDPALFFGKGYAAQYDEAFRLLAAGETFTAAELAERLGVSTSRTRDILRELAENDLAVGVGRPARFARS